MRRLDHVARVMEKLSASLVAALSASLLYLLLRRRAEAPIALLLTLAYAFGTTTWVIGSQALWQHGMAELLVIGALLLLTAPCTAPRALAAGLLCGLIACNRPPDAILAAALGRLRTLLGGPSPGGAARRGGGAADAAWCCSTTSAWPDNFAGGYGLARQAPASSSTTCFPASADCCSARRGGCSSSHPSCSSSYWLGGTCRATSRASAVSRLAMGAGVALQILLYAKTDWRAGISWGPRYLTDLLPLLVWMLVPVVAALRGVGRVCFLLAVGAAVAIQAIGAFWYTGATDSAIFAVASGPHRCGPRGTGRTRRSSLPSAWPGAGGARDRDARQYRRDRRDRRDRRQRAGGARPPRSPPARRSSPPAGRSPATPRPGRWRSSSTAGRSSPPAPSSTAPTSAVRSTRRAPPAGASRSPRPASLPASTIWPPSRGPPRTARGITWRIAS